MLIEWRYMATSMETSFSIHQSYPSSDCTECFDPIEELYRSIKSYMSGEDPKTESFQTTSRVHQEVNDRPNLFNIFLENASCVYKRICEEMGIEYLNVSYHSLNVSIYRKRHSEVSVLAMRRGYVDDMGVHSWHGKDLEQNKKKSIFFTHGYKK